MHVLHARSIAVVDDDGVGEEDECRVVLGSIGRVIGKGTRIVETREYYVRVWAQSFSFIGFLWRAWQ